MEDATKERYSKGGRALWEKMTPEEREKRLAAMMEGQKRYREKVRELLIKHGG